MIFIIIKNGLEILTLHPTLNRTTPLTILLFFKDPQAKGLNATHYSSRARTLLARMEWGAFPSCEGPHSAFYYQCY